MNFFESIITRFPVESRESIRFHLHVIAGLVAALIITTAIHSANI